MVLILILFGSGLTAVKSGLVKLRNIKKLNEFKILEENQVKYFGTSD